MVCSILQAQCWKIVSAGGDHSLGIKTDGTLWYWGNYADLSPKQIGTASNWLFVSAGSYHSLCLKNDSTLWAFGLNSNGQLGDSTLADTAKPVNIDHYSKWKYVDGGLYHSLGIKKDGSLWSWGSNGSGELGEGNVSSYRNYPKQIGNDTTWKMVKAGIWYSFGLKNDGSLWSWGYNNNGQLGNGTTVNLSVPQQVGNSIDWEQIAAGNLSMGIRKDGTLWQWGNASPIQTSPKQVGTDTNWTSVSCESDHALAFKSDESVWAWGYNYFGGLGDGTNTNKLLPTPISNGNIWSFLSAFDHSLGIKKDGTLWAWGANAQGQLGLGVNTSTNSPSAVFSSNCIHSTSINEIPSVSNVISLFPNPAKNSINLRLLNGGTIDKVVIVNLLGQCVHEQNQGCETVYINDLPVGMYSLFLFSSGEKFSNHFVKE